MTYAPKHLSLWTRPDCYTGAEWPDYWVFLGRNRDSDLVTESNFECALESLGGESDTVRVVRESHWACGWIEWIAIHKSDKKSLEIADSIMESLAGYPVLDDDDCSQREHDATLDYWESCSLRERIEYCADNGEPIYAARRVESIPETVYDAIRETVQCI